MLFDPSMQAALLAHVKLEADLRQAQENRQWILYYQPQVDHLGTITGVEALLRWQHPSAAWCPRVSLFRCWKAWS
ncbi:hypothetical protein HSBAA_58780 [Vreelandella sulfidaeris]|uniref:EAL domain-containing protein n=1 Tax=Vreelandella sulfidaeris TaxID=115553 RepID=A0A455UE59_9GAMM|nr:hypothetical protein HSBAA_58780 [Halomonas sulfidaeris]